MAARIPGLKRVNFTIQRELHKLAKRRARTLKIPDGVSGYIARLIKLDIKRKRKRVAAVPRLVGEKQPDQE